ncbi:PREDICTED: uncharacterized protein LOC108372889 [Rhagoletis zephyria]|uniref:uncharacterized protein LOC108372889 n=1 Tax=Rhagoletis zephyria TaxID=28612 RepID=UPI0008119509|nr:PREDICTED: uncharacterized protein LOC108372889 [Rhagoletis zephyria]
MTHKSKTNSSLFQTFMSAESNQRTSVRMPQQLSSGFVIEILCALFKVYQFKNVIIYVSERLNLNTEWSMEFFAEFFAAFPLIPNIIMACSNETNTIASIMNVLISPSLSLVFTTGPDDAVMALTAESMKRIRKLKTIFILLPTLDSDAIYESTDSYMHFWQIINNTYTWVWHKQFLNTILLTIRDHVYILDPYPTLEIINKTDNWHTEDFFVNYYHNFKGYVLDTMIRYDLPRIFDRRYEQDKLTFSGTSAKLFTSFVKSINATLIDSTVPSSPHEPAGMSQMIELIANRTTELSPHSFTALFAVAHVGMSYPIGINDWCIMVPFYNRSPEHLYLLRSFQYSTWLLLLFAVIYISITLWLCAPERPREYSKALLQSICSMLYIAPASAFNTRNPRMCFLFCCLYVIGFLTSNWYSTKIASYLMTSLPSPQLDTVDDVIRADLRIKVFDYEYVRLEHMPAQYPPRFLQQLDIVDKYFMDHHRDKLNTSFGYSIQSDRWEFLKLQQQFLRYPLFRRSSICIGPFHHVFPLYIDSHLSTPLKHFIMRATQSGFLNYWQKSAFADAVRLKLAKIILVHEDPIPLTLGFLLPIWYVWGLGLTIAVMIFICELYMARSRR